MAATRDDDEVTLAEAREVAAGLDAHQHCPACTSDDITELPPGDLEEPGGPPLYQCGDCGEVWQ
jgi:hypothetical protein